MIDTEALDAGGTLLFAEEALRRRREAEVDDLVLAAHWADLHAEDPQVWPAHRRRRGMAKLVRVGGEGTPRVQDLCLAELAISRRSHPLAARWLVADALDLRHRLPRAWAALLAGEAEPWVARRIAKTTRELTCAEAGYVDAAVAEALVGEQPGQVLALVEAKVIEANPDRHAERIATERRRRYVTIGRADAAGLRHLVARVEQGDAVWIDAMLDHVAGLLAARTQAHGDDPPSRDLLRSEAMGWLARPAELLTLLLEHQQQTDQDPMDPEEPDGTGDPAGYEASRAMSVPAELLGVLRRIDPARLRPQAVLYLHLHQAALTPARPGPAGAVARVEGGAPVLPQHLADLLGAARVTITPVVDLADQIPVTAYEHPTWLKERVQLLSPRDAFPHATTSSRNADYDHPDPYRSGPSAPPGQTGVHNSAPLRRFHHRAKTHAGYRVRCIKPGGYVWQTPHHRYRLVDQTGTHPVDEKVGDALFHGSQLEQGFAALALSF